MRHQRLRRHGHGGQARDMTAIEAMTTPELLGELARRGVKCVVSFARPGKNRGETDSGYLISGDYPSALGLLKLAEAGIIHDYFNRDSEGDDDDDYEHDRVPT